MTLKLVTCIVCSTDSDFKYKCPICRCPYCSLNCYKQHKNTSACTPIVETTKEEQPSSLLYRHITNDTVPVDKLEKLRENKKLIEILGNPHLRVIMEAINKSRDPSSLIHEAMLEPIFVEFADNCLKVVEDDD